MFKPELSLEQRLKDAYKCCALCGEKYGTYSVGCSSVYKDVCDVCGREDIPVTETRDWGYLLKGRRKLNLQEDAGGTLLNIIYEYPLSTANNEQNID